MHILLTGSIAVDRIMTFPGHYKDLIKPDKLHVLSVSILINELQDTRGGIAANIAYGLALLGEKPILYSSVGKNSGEYMKSLEAIGVNIEYLHYSELPTATFTVLNDQANCQVGGFYPGAMGDAQALDYHEFFTQDTKEEYFVVISSHDPAQMAHQVALCAKHGQRLFYDVGQQATNIPGEDIKAGIEAAELLIVNDYEMAVLVEKTGWTQEEILKKLKVCVITLGEKGCEIYQGSDKKTIVAANLVESVVDPTGAGDAFRAGFIYGYVREIPLETCAQLGSTLAAYAIENRGSQSYTATKSKVLDRCRASYDTFKATTIK